MPPIVALAPGSIGKNSPVPLSSALSCSRVTPACTRQSRSSPLTSSTLLICDKSTHTPPRGADPERDDRHRRGGAGPHDVRDLVGRVREHDEVGQRRVREALAVAVLLA